MARYEFKSVFADEIHNYINDKNSAGYNGANFRQNLISFDRFCTEQEIKEPVFTTYHASKWMPYNIPFYFGFFTAVVRV